MTYNLDEDLCLRFSFWRRIYAQDLFGRDDLPEDGSGSWRGYGRRGPNQRTKRIFIPVDVDDYMVAPWKWPSLAHGKHLTSK